MFKNFKLFFLQFGVLKSTITFHHFDALPLVKSQKEKKEISNIYKWAYNSLIPNDYLNNFIFQKEGKSIVEAYRKVSNLYNINLQKNVRMSTKFIFHILEISVNYSRNLMNFVIKMKKSLINPFWAEIFYTEKNTQWLSAGQLVLVKWLRSSDSVYTNSD